MTKLLHTHDNITPGTIVISKFDAKPYLVLSMPSYLRPLQLIVKVAPIKYDFSKLKCPHNPHIILPTNLKTKGIICIHKEETLNCTDIKIVEALSEPLKTYTLSHVKY